MMNGGVVRFVVTNASCAIALNIFVVSLAWAQFSDVVIGGLDIPFLLDKKGNVWAFNEPTKFGSLVKLNGLGNIKKIAPFVALNENGQVYMWSLDARSRVNAPDIEIVAQYTTPKLLPYATEVSLIASNGINRIAVVKNDRDILEFEGAVGDSIYDYGKSLRVGDYRLVRDIHMNSSVKAIELGVFSTIAILSNAEIIGWNLRRDANTPGKDVAEDISFDAQSAASAINITAGYDRAVMLLDDGHVIFYGDCTPEPSIHYSKHIHLSNGITLPVTEVQQLAIAGGWIVFLKRDGSVWATQALLSSYDGDFKCGRGMPKIRRVEGMTIPAAKIAGANRGYILALGVDHSVWLVGFPGSGNLPMNFVRILSGE